MNELAGKRILFFIPGLNAEGNPIMVSQILGLARYAAGLGAECAVFHANGSRLERTYELEPHVRMINHASRRVKSNLLNVVRRFWRLANEFSEEIRGFGPTHIYTRNCYTCLGVRAIAKDTGAKVIFSVRGPAAEEIRLAGGFLAYIRSCLVAHYENAAMMKCDILSTLSYGYKRYLEPRYGRLVVGVIPCCVDERFFVNMTSVRRKALRAEFGFDEKNRVVVWGGSFAHWQRLEDIVDLMRGICLRDESYRVLFLTDQHVRLAEMCKHHGFPAAYWRTKYCKAHEMPEYLQLADVALNLQHPGTLHSRTCSPVKIPEYLASGLPVLVSKVMGDMPDVIERDGVGVVLPDDLNPSVVHQQMERLSCFDGERARRCAREHFTWEGNRVEITCLFSA